MEKQPIYLVQKLRESIYIDAVWNKSQWQDIKPINLNYSMGDLPAFRPFVQAKMMYNDDNIYIIFMVSDRYVRCITKNINGPVWEDSAVEFFFAPHPNSSETYFNLEVNCGGTPLMHYNRYTRNKYKPIDPEDILEIEIAHSLPKIVDPEISESVTWSIEYRIPIEIIKKYSSVTDPKPGSIWKGNFYKCGDKTSNPHFLTWSFVNHDKPNFHLPQFFGALQFE